MSEGENRKVFQPDTYAKYYSFYTGSLGRYEIYDTGCELNQDGHRFIMNLNINNIVNKTESLTWPGGFSGLRMIVRHRGNYLDIDNNEHPYEVRYYGIANRHLLVFLSDTAMMSAAVDQTAAVQLAESMLVTARSIQIDDQEIRLAFSKDEKINYYGRKMQLFDSVTPENGMISEIMEDESGQ